ncbi:MAG: ABC transporter permease [Clostridia bacterium]|nr:ABC transporter permease [Clostridia bacterium]
MKRPNFSLILGSVLLALILIIMLFPQLFSGKSPYTLEQLRFLVVDDKLEIELAPHPPSDDFPLGSDDYGRDIYSRIIYGTRLTISLGILIALGRFLLAVPMALSAGFGNETSKSIIKQFNTVFSAIPAILISIIVLSLDFFSGLNKSASILSFVVVLSIVGWANIGDVIHERVTLINKQSFITAETAIGKRKLKIATENVIPHLAPELIVLFFMEIARALSMLMQLGIFSIFIGNLKIIIDSDNGTLVFANVSFEPEWASMLGSSRNMLHAAPWALLYPALAFFISVLAFNLFGEGLRSSMQKKDSAVIPFIRKLISFNLIKSFKTSATSAKIKLAVFIILLGGIIAVQSIFSNAKYNFEIENPVDLRSEQAIISTVEADEAAEAIIDKMKELNIEPLYEEGYMQEYDIDKTCINTAQSFVIHSGNTSLEFEANKDYSFISTGSFNYTAPVYDASKDDLYSLSEFSKFDDKFVMINKSYYSDSYINYILSQIDLYSSAKGVFLYTREDREIENYILNRSDDMFILNISNTLSDTIKDNIDENITVSAEIKNLGTSGNNLIGIYHGEGALAEEAILIGMRYNYLDKDGKDILNFNLELMRRLCISFENKRSIIFLFVDGTLNPIQNGIYALAQDFPYTSSKVNVFIDLTGLNSADFDEVAFSSAQAPFTRQFAWSVAHQLESSFEKERIETAELATVYSNGEYIFTEDPEKNTLFWERGIATIVINTEKGGSRHNISDIGRILLEVINKNNY